MNLFFGIPCAELYDTHVSKMVLETAQMLCTAFRIRAAKQSQSLAWMYKSTHKRHPVVIWVASDRHHFDFTIKYGLQLADEFELRFNKVHKSRKVIESLQVLGFPQLESEAEIPHFAEKSTDSTVVGLEGLPANISWFPLCMPAEFYDINARTAYRNYYLSKKLTMKVKPTNRRLDKIKRLKLS